MANKKIYIAVFLILAACLTVGSAIWNQMILEIQMVGDMEQTLIFGEDYRDAGAEVRLRGRNFFQEGIPIGHVAVKVSGAVDTQTIGSYALMYEAEFAGLSASASRTVKIIDTEAPVILLKDWSVDTVTQEAYFEEPGFSAKDNYDGDITHKVIRTESPEIITYEVTDSSGNSARVSREIPQYVPVAPQIQLSGDQIYKLKVSIPFVEPGYTAYDDVDGDLTHLVTVEGEVDSLHPGEYQLVYTVADSELNEAQEIRTVIVEAVSRPNVVWPEHKTIYLTFDDGPGPYTMQLLDILDQYGVRATFFVMNTEYIDILQEIVRRGHSIGIHSTTHDYEEIYASPQAYFADLYEMQQIIYENTGVVTSLMRFPGGGSNLVSKRWSEGIMSVLTVAVQDAGFQYFDWNVDSDDAGNAKHKKDVLENVIKGTEFTEVAMVLQHDIHSYSVAAVEDIIRWGLDHGYQFLAIRNSTPGFHHDVLN